MKNLVPLFIATIFILSTSCNNFIAEPQIDIQDSYADIRFTRKTSNDQLDFIKSELKKRNVEIQFPDIRKDGDLLSELSFELNYNGNAGYAKTNFINLRGKDFGITIDFSKGEFLVGDLEKLAKK